MAVALELPRLPLVLSHLSRPLVSVRQSGDEYERPGVTRRSEDCRKELMSMNAIEVEGLSKVYRGGVMAVNGLDFEVTPGEVFGLLGPNGAGKSTTVGMLTTTVVPTA